jgi:hypothetical protein
MQIDDRMVVIKAITTPIANIIENVDDQITAGSWEADMPGRGEMGGICIIFKDSMIEITISEEDVDSRIDENGNHDPNGPLVYHMEHSKSFDLADPNSLDAIVKVMKAISNGFSPVDGEDGWEEV